MDLTELDDDNATETGEILQKNSGYIVPNLDRALTVLEFLVQGHKACGVSDISRALNIPKNSVFRILQTLTARGYTSVGEYDRLYQVTGKLLSLGHAIVSDSSLLEMSYESLAALRDESRETVLIGVMVHHRGMVLDQYPSPQPVKFLIGIGHQFPLHTAAPGKIFLAYLPEQQRNEMLREMDFVRYTDKTITDKKEFLKELLTVREQGYALDRGEELESLRCVAAPIFNYRSEVVAAVWITCPAFRVSEEHLLALSEPTVRAARTISVKLGWKCPSCNE